MSKWISVLVIEDDEVVRKVLEYYLKLYGFRVHLAEDGPTGLSLAQESVPELILLDWMLPGMDGLEVLSELKHNGKTEHIPVFMLTGRGMIADLEQAFEVGADDYIRKPFDLSDLGKMVKAKWDKYVEQAGVD